MAEENDVMLSATRQNIEALKKIEKGDVSGVYSLDTENLESKKQKNFNLLGIYSRKIRN